MSSRRFCVLALLGTAAIHVAAVPEHLHEWPAAAAFFVVLAVAEVALAAGIALSDSRRLLIAGVAVSVFSAGLWVMSRTVGLPIGPDPFTAEAAATPGVLATALEIFTAAVLVRLATRRSPVQAHAHA